MPLASDIQRALERIKESLENVHTEDELEKLFLGAGFYEALGYKTIGRDIRGKAKGPGGIPDVLLVNEDESIQAVLEFKRPSEKLFGHPDQLLTYAKELRPPYALLTNGRVFWLYERRGDSWVDTESATLEKLIEDPSPLLSFSRTTLDLQNQEKVLAALECPEEEQIPIRDPNGEGGRQFLAAFGLTKEGGEPAKSVGELGPFGQLVDATYRLVGALHKESRFLEGAYEFWKKAYAQKPEEVPKSWEVFQVSGQEGLYQLMFALQTSYALTARLILAKVVEDYAKSYEKGLRPPLLSELLGHELKDPGHRSNIPPWAYPQAVRKVFNEYAEHFLPSLYISDIFDWWQEKFPDEPAYKRFGEALGRVLLALFRFNFRQLQGDFLGELYQAYFDPETRKALGEFYTPPPVVDFILDQVGYQGEGRLLDPACGSGTFLIHALRRFILKEKQRGSSPQEILRKLTKDYVLVGFDINPFAVMMSQVNLVSHLVEIYLEAFSKEPELVLRHLPVVQTDSLRQELLEGTTPQRHAQVGLNLDEEKVTLRVPLPIKEKAPETEIVFPNPERAIGEGLVRNESEWILALEALFEAVYQRNREVETGLHPRSWDKLFQDILKRIGLPHNLAQKLEPYAKQVWQVLENLKPKHGDGRFIKALMDFALGMALKHIVRYQYVVGNPPYVRIQNLPNFQKDHWRKIYTWVDGNFDIFIPFIERAFLSQRSERPGWLEEGGRLGFITSDRFLNVGYAVKLRESLPQRARLISLVHLGAATFNAAKVAGGERPFKEASVYPAIFIWENHKPEDEYAFPAARFLPKQVSLTLEEALRDVKDAFSKLDKTKLHIRMKGCAGDAFLAQSTWLWPRGWYVMPPHERQVWEKIDRIGHVPGVDLSLNTIPPGARRLLNITVTTSGGFAGVQTSLDEVLVLKQIDEDEKKGLLYLVPKGKEGDPKSWKNPVAIEKEVLRPFLFGRDVDRWYLDWKGYWVVFPYWYGEVGNRRGWHLIPTEENLGLKYYQDWPEDAPILDRDYPHLWSYLKAHEKVLRAREKGRYRKGTPEEWCWYDLGRPQNLEAATNPKLLIQLLASEGKVAWDKEGKFLFQAGGKGGGVYGISLKEDALSPLLLGVLNSFVGDFYIKSISSSYSGGYYSYADAFIKWLPIPEISEEYKEELTKLVHRVEERTARLRKMRSELEGFPQSVMEELKKQGKAPPRKTLESLAIGINNLAREVSAKKDTSLQKDLNGSLVLRLGKGTILFQHEAHARLVLKALKARGSVSREELLNWEIPENPNTAEEFLRKIESLEEDQNRIELSTRQNVGPPL